MDHHFQATFEFTPITLHVPAIERQGFGDGYTARRHRWEALANEGIVEARQDWQNYIGPTTSSSIADSYYGDFASLAFPFARPERLQVIAYILEFTLLYDDMVTSTRYSRSACADTENKTMIGVRKMRSKIAHELKLIDNVQGKQVLEALRLAPRMTRGTCTNMDEYLSLRLEDSKSSLNRALLLFGMGMRLSAREKDDVRHIVVSAEAALALTNDYFAFDQHLQDREGARRDSMDLELVINSVWLTMDWNSLDVKQSKQKIRAEIRRYEVEFREGKRDHLDQKPCPSERVWKFLEAYSHLVVGNMVWSLSNCRYRAGVKYGSDATSECQFQTDPRPDRYTQGRGRSDTLVPSTHGIKPDLKDQRQGEKWRSSDFAALRLEMSAPADCTSGLRIASIPTVGCGKSSKEKSEPRKDSCVSSNSPKLDSTRTTPELASPSSHTASSTSMTSPDLISPMTSPGWISPLSSPTWSESAHDCASIENFRFPTPTVLNNQTLLEPYEWCANLPQKNARNILIDAVNFWTQVPEPTANEIESAIAELHTAFLLLDDIEDASDIRRGKPTAHLIFGVSETINSANYAIFEALDRLRRLPNAPLDELATQMRHLFTGQCHELRFTRQGVCPSEAEYFQIIDSKTGGLFRMLVGLLTAHAAPSTAADAAKDDLTQLFTLVGRALQIRGDYLNLTAAQAGDAQGFGDDIDEGKFSYPMVDAFGSQTSATAAHVSVLRAVLAARREAGGLSREMKELACEKLVACGALRRTREKLVSLLGQIDERLVLVEELFRCENPLLRSMLERLAL